MAGWGDASAATDQYDRCREAMLRELGVEPLAEATELYRAIVESRLASRGGHATGIGCSTRGSTTDAS